MNSRISEWQPWLLMAGAWGLAFTLACHLTGSLPAPGSSEGVASLLLGESRRAISQDFFNTADQYFHKGVTHHAARIALHDLFQRWNSDITPEQHSHADGAGSAEILPWLKLATRTDPHNVDAFLVSAFWASTGLQRFDLANSILDEAQRLNPGDYRIPLEKGRMAIRRGAFEKAQAALGAALNLIPVSDGDQKMDRAEIFTFLGFLKESKGFREEAIRNFKNALAIFPERSYIKERVTLLETGKEPTESALVLLKKLTQQTAHDACQDDDDDHDHDHAGDHGH